MARRLAAIAIFVLIAIAAVGPIRSYDFFWHLATGRWIVQHHALPLYDPFALAGSHVPWINGEWLYEVVLYPIWSLVGLRAISWVNALFIAVLFALAFWWASRVRDLGVSLLATTIAFAGAADRLGIRPAAAAALLVLCALALLDSALEVRPLTIAYAILTIVWINTHPSALLAPLLAATTLTVELRRWPVPAASAASLMINPFGWRAITSPLHLTQLVGSGEFVNAEWLPSTPEFFPLLYVTIGAVIVLNLSYRPTRRDWWRVMTFLILAALALRHVRNQGLYFAAFPLLLPPNVRMPRPASMILAICAIIPIAWVFAHSDHQTGVDAERFPVRAVSQLKATALPGHIYNVDQFGGYLEWMYFGERRVLTDGRNELFRDFIALDAKARQDSRLWHALLRRYAIDLAVDEYQSEKVEVLDVGTGERHFLPASLIRYRRRDWALIAFDDAAMVFARRRAFSPGAIERLEYRYLVPDDPFIGYMNDAIKAGARTEIARARRELGDLNVIRQLEQGAAN